MLHFLILGNSVISLEQRIQEHSFFFFSSCSGNAIWHIMTWQNFLWPIPTAKGTERGSGCKFTLRRNIIAAVWLQSAALWASAIFIFLILSSWPRRFLLVSFKMLKIYRMWIAWTSLKTTADKIKQAFAEKFVYLLIVLACVQNFSNNLLCHTGALEFRLVASFKTCAFPGAALCFVITWELSDGFIPPTEAERREQCADKQIHTCMHAGTLLHCSHTLH